MRNFDYVQRYTIVNGVDEAEGATAEAAKEDETTSEGKISRYFGICSLVVHYKA